MTDKQIIIDGVDVSECCWCDSEPDTEPYCRINDGEDLNCEENPNCYFKQLKRKEQECEELKEDRERWKSNFNGKVSAIEELLQQLDQFKQTLTEIKPILELYANSKIGEEQLDGTYKIIVEDSKVLGDMYITFDPRPAKQALQKISKCEVENAVVSSYYDKSERKEINEES